MTNDIIADALSSILNAEKTSKESCLLYPVSKVLNAMLQIMKDQKYIGSFTEIEDSKGNSIKLNLLGNVNKCGVIKPRFPVQKEEFIKFEKRFLPSRNVGIIFVSTSQGIMTNKEAMEKGIGGTLLGYCY